MITVENSEMDDESYDYKDMLRRDERRWNLADVDKDGKLSKAEFASFLHPEEVEHMRGIVVDVSEIAQVSMQRTI